MAPGPGAFQASDYPFTGGGSEPPGRRPADKRVLLVGESIPGEGFHLGKIVAKAVYDRGADGHVMRSRPPAAQSVSGATRTVVDCELRRTATISAIRPGKRRSAARAGRPA